MINQLWTDKYKPINIVDIIGNKLQIKQIIEWVSLVKTKKKQRNIYY